MTHLTLLVTVVLMLVTAPAYANDHHKSNKDEAKHHIVFTSETVQWLDGPVHESSKSENPNGQPLGFLSCSISAR
ncbi:hypothetical protein FM042_09965 [Aliidiomarina halalkaliphila]|uniref:Uncharacterized protein n=1 Tax=Aliidiomarina halalkaliphila TaxID=2593535 RepID=A0A552X0D2_9GAMM|nr:hypothetical protein [Aliidiomarina halalkaliphila]TRW48484.1 hypothetical protein FM042_09965 [Aliidiomarina halalkaliphila]